MKTLAIVTAQDFQIPARTHQARCLTAGCYMADKPQTAISRADAMGWAQAHITGSLDHTVAIEELDPEPVKAA